MNIMIIVYTHSIAFIYPYTVMTPAGWNDSQARVSLAHQPLLHKEREDLVNEPTSICSFVMYITSVYVTCTSPHCAS